MKPPRKTYDARRRRMSTAGRRVPLRHPGFVARNPRGVYAIRTEPPHFPLPPPPPASLLRSKVHRIELIDAKFGSAGAEVLTLTELSSVRPSKPD